MSAAAFQRSEDIAVAAQETVVLRTSTSTAFCLPQTIAAQSKLNRATQHKKRIVVVLDIEGATTPLPFVTKTLFPIADANYGAFLDQHFPGDARIVKFVEDAARDSSSNGMYDVVPLRMAFARWRADGTAAAEADVRREFVLLLRTLTAKNLKVPYFKQLQGLLWEGLYASGAIKGELFDDAAWAIRRWASLPNHEVHIYSSGSVHAQKLLLRHSTHGDMTRFVMNHHDTVTVGAKTDPRSYDAIARSVLEKSGLPRQDVAFVFVSDAPAELRAAVAAGFDAVFLCIRPLNLPVDVQDVPGEAGSIVTFDQLAHVGVQCLMHLREQFGSYGSAAGLSLKSFL